MKTIFWFIALIALALAFFFITQHRGKKISTVPLQNPLTGEAMQNYQIVDVRTPEEFTEGAYPKAVNIPVDILPEKLDTLDKTKPVLVYCASGRRSAIAANILRKAGFKEVRDGGAFNALPK